MQKQDNRRPESSFHQPDRTSLSWLLFAIFGVCSLPMLIYGGYLLVCWFRIHTSDVYYVDYSYMVAAFIWIGIGLFSLLWTLYAARRGGFFSLLFVVPVFLCFQSLIFIPNQEPIVVERLLYDDNYLSRVRSFFDVWYEAHHKFPVDESEFKKAMAEGPAKWHNELSPTPESHYEQRGNPLPYEIVVVTNATGARVTDVSQRPGIIYYCVSSDLQEFWVTMTALHSDVARAATIQRVANDPIMDYWMVHESGRDLQ